MDRVSQGLMILPGPVCLWTANSRCIPGHNGHNSVFLNTINCCMLLHPQTWVPMVRYNVEPPPPPSPHPSVGSASSPSPQNFDSWLRSDDYPIINVKIDTCKWSWWSQNWNLTMNTIIWTLESFHPGEIDICPEMRRGVHFTIFGAVLLTASRVFLGFGSGTNQN